MSSQFKIPLILQIAVFIIPMNIYVIGDWIGTGIQWVLFRYINYQDKISILILPREISFITSGILIGKSAFASILWATGAVLFVVATFLIMYGTIVIDPAFTKKGVFVNLGGAVLFLLSIFLQYGISLHSPAGIAIPFGIIILFIIAFWQYRVTYLMDYEPDTDEEELSIENLET